MVSGGRTIPGRQCPWVRNEVPEAEVDDLAVDFDGGGEVVEDCWLVVLGEFVLDKAGLGGSYLTRMQVFPMAPSPTMTNLTETGYFSIYNINDEI